MERPPNELRHRPPFSLFSSTLVNLNARLCAVPVAAYVCGRAKEEEGLVE